MRIVPHCGEKQVGTVFIHKATDVHQVWNKFKKMDYKGEDPFSPLKTSTNSHEWEKMNISYEDYSIENDSFM